MDKKLLTILLLIGAASIYLYQMGPTYQKSTEFEKFKIDHGKFYMGQEEEQYRKAVFLANLAKIKAHNADPTQTYQMGVNQFTDLTETEFIETYLQTKIVDKFHDEHFFRTEKQPDVRADVDWVSQGKVSGIKNQGSCGSCWAFSATAAIESAYLISSGATPNLSQQQLVDCSRSYGNQGCSGGWMDSAFAYVKEHGLVSTGEYAYVARDQACKIDSGSNKISGYIDVPNCSNLENALSARPISVAVDASRWSSYSSGVFTNCGKNVNHGVLLVGISGGNWKIKNSWGSGWGESGYIRLGAGDTCAVCQYPSYPTL